jgi:hypothetical protein
VRYLRWTSFSSCNRAPDGIEPLARTKKQVRQRSFKSQGIGQV